MPTILAALHARLQPFAATVLIDEVLPERISPAGQIILRDGQPREPEVTLSPLCYHYPHRAELEVIVQGATDRATAFDTLIAAIGTTFATAALWVASVTGSRRQPQPWLICLSMARLR